MKLIEGALINYFLPLLISIQVTPVVQTFML